MFYYQDTGKLSQPGELQRKVITKVRQVTYLHNNPNPKIEEPLRSAGFEPVEELVVSPEYDKEPQLVETKTIDNRRTLTKEE